MRERALCPICAKHRPERYCPAKGEKICAVCCGTEREVTLDCPADCSYLIKAHRYEQEHRQPLNEDQLPFPKIEISSALIYERQPLLVGLSRAILNYAAEHREITDSTTLDALMALAETYRTMVSGIFYQKPPDSLAAAGLYAAIEELLSNLKQENQQRGLPTLKDGEIFQLLVFLARIARTHTNQRRRARIFLEFMRGQLPPEEKPSAEPSRIIIP
jgi:hypothetical protein